ncbi:MAG: PH domain-containing protein, partial [Verrucomicrobiales bacterium]|nr:PH domain-containing protein [Verrucomicrobiales bacterium]
CERVREVLDWEDDVEKETVPKPDPNPDMPVQDSRPAEKELNQPPTDPALILYAGHQSLISFPKTLFLLLLSLGLGIWFRETSGWILFLGLLIALLCASYIILERSSRLYVITPKRVEIVKGLFAKSSNEVQIKDIRTINVVRKGFAGMIGVGRVEFASSGGKDVEVAFDDVWAAQKVKGLVRRIQDARSE